MTATSRFRIGDFGKVVTGKTPPTEKTELYGDRFPFITPTDIDASRYCEPERRLSEEGADSMRKLELRTGSVCVTCIASVGKMCMTKEPSFTNQQINSIIVDRKRHEPAFVYYLLHTQIELLKAVAGGTATPIINKTIFSRLPALAPPLELQKKMAAILSGYDELIENNKRRIALLEKLAEEIYREWFIRLRFPGHEKIKLNKGVPTGWEVNRVDSIGRLVTGKTPSTDQSRYYGEEYMFVKTPDMHGNVFLLNTTEKLTQDGLDSQPSQTIPEGSICVSCIGTGGIVSITTSKCQTNQQINSVVLKDQSELEWAFFTLRGLKETIELFGSTGTTMTNLSKGKFAGLKIAAR